MYAEICKLILDCNVSIFSKEILFNINCITWHPLLIFTIFFLLKTFLKNQMKQNLARMIFSNRRFKLIQMMLILILEVLIKGLKRGKIRKCLGFKDSHRLQLREIKEYFVSVLISKYIKIFYYSLTATAI